MATKLVGVHQRSHAKGFNQGILTGTYETLLNFRFG